MQTDFIYKTLTRLNIKTAHALALMLPIEIFPIKPDLLWCKVFKYFVELMYTISKQSAKTMIFFIICLKVFIVWDSKILWCLKDLITAQVTKLWWPCYLMLLFLLNILVKEIIFITTNLDIATHVFTMF